MAGARIGYAIGPAELIAGFDRIRNHFGINRIAPGRRAGGAERSGLARPHPDRGRRCPYPHRPDRAG